MLVPPGASLVTHGPYRLMRHPNYLAVVGEIAGVALIVWAPITGAAALARLRLADVAPDRGRRSRPGARMSGSMPSLAPLPIPSGLTRSGGLPGWVRIVDAVALALVLVGVSAVITGGFRTEIAGVRVSVTSWWRPLAVAVLVAARRHAALPPADRWSSASHDGWIAWRRDAITGAIGPMVIASRVGVLVIGLMAVHAIGYPGRPRAVPRRRQRGWQPAGALRRRAGTCKLATYGYEYLPNRFDRQQNLVFFPAFPVLMSLASLLVARQTLWAGTLLSMAAFAWAARYLYRLARDLMDADRAQTAVALACLYPFAVFYSAAYTEALFLLAMLGAWYHLRARRALAGVCAGACWPG